MQPFPVAGRHSPIADGSFDFTWLWQSRYFQNQFVTDAGQDNAIPYGGRRGNSRRGLSLSPQKVNDWIESVSQGPPRRWGAPSLRFLQGWAAMLPAQLLSVLYRLLLMPSSYSPFFAYAKDGAPA